mmetsp:Transcript_12576/g.22404  ORF Transcript_12576/g.22404 Transcript_12576/m.22404 type:complete len:256 (-) Transcript_12576:507-1274(-)
MLKLSLLEPLKRLLVHLVLNVSISHAFIGLGDLLKVSMCSVANLNGLFALLQAALKVALFEFHGRNVQRVRHRLGVKLNRLVVKLECLFELLLFVEFVTLVLNFDCLFFVLAFFALLRGLLLAANALLFLFASLFALFFFTFESLLTLLFCLSAVFPVLCGFLCGGRTTIRCLEFDIQDLSEGLLDPWVLCSYLEHLGVGLDHFKELHVGRVTGILFKLRVGLHLFHKIRAEESTKSSCTTCSHGGTSLICLDGF